MNTDTEGIKPRGAGLLAIVAVFSLVMLLGCQASATPTVGVEFPIANTPGPTQFNQERAAAVAAGGGGYLAVWQDNRSQVDYDIYGILLDANGNPTQTEGFLISRIEGGLGAPTDQTFPRVAYNGTQFLVVWVDAREGSSNAHIYGSRVTASGTVLDVGGIVIRAGTNSQSAPAAASDGTNWEVVWEEYTTGGTTIYGSRVLADGTPGTAVALASTGSDRIAPAIAWNGTNYLVAWQDYRNSISTGADIYGCRVTSDGQKTGFDILISTAVGSSSSGAPNAQTTPSVAATSSGNSLVVWQDERGTNTDAYGARVDSSGTVQDVGGIAIGSGAGDQESPGVGWDGTCFVVAWRDKNASSKIFARRISTSGTVLDPTAIAVSTSTAGKYCPEVAGGSGNSVVVWNDQSLGAADIYGNTVASNGSAGSVRLISKAPPDQPMLAAAFDVTKFVVAWADNRSGSYNIYAARVSKRGTVFDPQGVALTTGGDDRFDPAIAYSGSNYLVVWAERGASWDIKGLRISSSTLAPLDPAPITICSIDLDQTTPCVAWNGSNYLVAWADARDGNSFTNIHGAMVNATSGVVTQMTSAICGAANSQLKPRVASDGTNFLVTWEDYRSGTAEVYLGRVNNSGVRQDGDGVKVSSFASAKTSPAVAYDGTNFLIAWSDSRGTSSDIYGVRIGTNGARVDLSDIAMCTAAGSQTLPSVAWTGDNYYVAWQDDRNSASNYSDVFMTRVSSFGSVIDAGGFQVSAASHPELRPCVVASGADYATVFYNDLIYSINRLAARVCSEGTPTSMNTVQDVKNQIDGKRVRISNKVVTAGTDQLTSCFYIEEADRSSGIKVVSGDPIREEYVVTVTGTVETVGGERQITASTITINSQTGTVPAPYGMKVLSLGGSAANQYTPGVQYGQGPHNLGLLIKTWGKATQVSGNIFMLDDGGKVILGEHSSELVKTKIICPAGVTPPAEGAFVCITGISSCELSGSDSIRRVLVRKVSDIQ